jgi:hypothetical protein
MRPPTTWVDGSFPDRMADSKQAMVDVREAHAWATQELATAAPGSIREFMLREERKRLAGIAEVLKTGRRRSAVPPYEDRRAEYLKTRGASA